MKPDLEAIKIATEIELKQGLQILNEFNDDKKYKQVQRKLESLSSIQRLALFFEKHQND